MPLAHALTTRWEGNLAGVYDALRAVSPRRPQRRPLRRRAPDANQQDRVFVVRDPLYGNIHLNARERTAIDSDIFQRQRGIKQLGTSALLYPSAVQTRFVHALGNLELIGRMVDSGLRNAKPATVSAFCQAARSWLMEIARGNSRESERISQLAGRAVCLDVRQIARFAGLCHDLGHFPMGHVLEYALQPLSREVLAEDDHAAFQEWQERGARLHEFATIRLLETNGAPGEPVFAVARDSTYHKATVAVIKAIHEKNPHLVARAIAELVSGEIDSDRAEYLRRDGYVSGSGYGQYDLDRLFDSYTLVRAGDEFHFRPSTHALVAVEEFLLERVRAYGSLYYHNVGMLMDALLVRVLSEVLDPNRQIVLLREAQSSWRSQLKSALSRLRARGLSYEQFANPEGYFDDARLWESLRAVAAVIDRRNLLDRQRSLRRLRTYLRAVLRRRRVWVSLWKNPDEFRRLSQAAKTSFENAVTARDRDANPEATLGDLWRTSTGLSYDPAATPFLNAFARVFATEQLQLLAQKLEERLLSDKKVRRLKTDLFAEVSERVAFRPIKKPSAFELVNDRGKLQSLDQVARSGVTSILSLWYNENIHLRLYVLSDRELDEDSRELVRQRAQDLLPEALYAWYSEDQRKAFLTQVIAARE